MKRILLSVLAILFITVAQAQVPQQLNYQGIARNASGAPITYQNITVRISLIDSATGGQAAYRETRRVMTNYVGLFNILIGSKGATNVMGTIEDVNWSTGKKYIKLEIDPNGLSNFSLAGVTQLQSVPYALSATPSGYAGGDLTGAYPSPLIADNVITSSKIKDESVSLSKLSPSVVTTLTNKLNISDTAAMLAPYETKIDITNSIAGKVNVSDTAAMLNPYYRSATAEANIASINTTLNSETARATNVENVLTANLATETTNRTDGDVKIANNLNAETTNRINADDSIKNNLTTETARAIAAEATKENAANKSTATSLGTSDVLFPTQNAVKTYVDAASTGNSTALASEITNRINADDSIKNNLATETTRATNSENALATNLTAEITNRTNGDDSIKNNLTTETARATTAETLLGTTKENAANKSTATSLGTSDVLFPTQNAVKTYVDVALSGSSAALASEITSRINADDSIKNDLATETTRATNSENTLTTNLSAEVTDRINSDDSIKNNLATETTRATNSENALATNLSAETTNRINADDSIKNNLATETTRATNSENTLTTNLSAEVTNRINADDSIKNNLADETARATAAETLLGTTKENTANKSTATTLGTSDVLFPTQNAVKTYVDAASSGSSADLASEIANRTNADDSIKNNLATEITRATNSENTLATNLSAEVTNRTNADDSIKNDLASEITRATDSENTLTTNLSAEVTNRINADDSIKNNLADETARGIAAEATKENTANKSTATTLGTSDVLFPTQNAVKTYVDAASSGSFSAVASEITNRINADDSIKNNLSTETARATAAEATKENAANKSTSIALGTSDVLFPTQNAVKTYVDVALTGNSTALTVEVARAKAAEGLLKTDTETNAANIAVEITRAMAAEDALTTATQTALDTKINIADTTAMLLPYAKDAATQTALNTKVNIADTATMLSSYINVTDTATMLSPYAKDADVALKAPLASPAFTGIPTAPTAASSNNSAQIATTEFVQNLLLNSPASATSVAWATSTTGNLNGVNFIITNIVASGLSDWDLSTADFSAAPLSATQSLVGYEGANDWTITFESSISKLRLYARYWRAGHYEFSQPFTILSGSGLMQSGNTLTVTGWGNGIIEFTDPITTLSVVSDQSCCSSQIMTFGANTQPIAGTGEVVRVSSPTFTGTVSGITKSMVGLSNVDNTSDAAKPISILTQTALNTKLNISDTTAMLLPYAKEAATQSAMNTKVNIADTAAMLLPYAKAAALTGFVDLATDQTIAGIKTYNSEIVAKSFKKSGGTSAQILAADGSVITAGTNISISSGTISATASPVREVADEFTATAAQTSFTLTQTPSVNSKVKMYINGIRISNTAYSVSGATLTYNAANNGAYALTASDRIQFDYYY